MAAHIATNADGSPKMAYAAGDDRRWWGEANQISADDSIDSWIERAGLNYPVFKVPSGSFFNGIWYESGDFDIVTPNPNHEKLAPVKFGTVAERYKIDNLQPRNIVEFFGDTSADFGLKLCTAGALRGGAVVWAQAEAEKSLVRKGEDTMKHRLLLSTSYDGTLATDARNCETRVVCMNTLRAARGEKDAVNVKTRHSTIFDPARIKARMGLLPEYSDWFAESANRLVERKVSEDELNQVLFQLFGKPIDSSLPTSAMVPDNKGGQRPNLTTQSANTLDNVKLALVNAPGHNLESCHGTAWGALNAVTYYVDHASRAHESENRTYNAWFGKGDQVKATAFSTLLELAIGNTVSASLESILSETPA